MWRHGGQAEPSSALYDGAEAGPRPEGPNVGVPAPGHDGARRVRARAVHDTPEEADVSEYQMPICFRARVTSGYVL